MQDRIKLLKDLIKQRTSFIGGDCYTFIMGKSRNENYIHLWGTGGGNFLMAVGLFSVINFLAKVYRHLVEPTAFISEADRQSVIDTKTTLKTEHPELKQVISGWQNPRIGDVNEMQTFIKLGEALPKNIDLGISQQDNITAENVWKVFRNFLTHMAWPGSSVATIHFQNLPTNLTIEQMLQVIDNSGMKSFYKENSQLRCNSDKLTVDANKIANWLCEQLDNSQFTEANIESTLAWIQAD